MSQRLATTPQPPPVLLTVEQAAAAINMSPRYVRRLVAERHIPVCRFGRSVRLNADDLTAYIADCTTQPITPSTVWCAIRKAS